MFDIMKCLLSSFSTPSLTPTILQFPITGYKCILGTNLLILRIAHLPSSESEDYTEPYQLIFTTTQMIQLPPNTGWSPQLL